jgi:hypothetical protein
MSTARNPMISLMKKLNGRSAARSRLVASAAVTVLVTLCLTLPAPAQQAGAAVVRHGFSLDGRIEGSVRQLSGEGTAINGGASLTGTLLVPGVPAVRQTAESSLGGVTQGAGGEEPAGYEITLNGNASLGRLTTRTDPVDVPAVAAPPAATGTRDIALDSPDQSPGDFSTVRDLTLNADAGSLPVPAGRYRSLTANGGSTLVLGVAGDGPPTVYSLDSLTLNGGSRLQVVGPVVLTVTNAVSLSGATGAEGHPLWLELRVASGGVVTLNGGGALYGSVNAPSGTVTINRNAVLTGNVVCDRLAINGGGLLRIVQ